jgi:hypothetical protein
VWTPRRILLLFSGLAVFLLAYVGYGFFLGGVDGLPALPERFLDRADGLIIIPDNPRSPSESRLEQAFGVKCPELEDPAYKTKMELRDRGIVFAAGPIPDIKEPTKKLRISPLSLAHFSRPSANAKPDDAPEIVTLHADEAVLEYDRPVTSRTEILQGQARLVGVELIGNPEAEYRDLRKGRVIITHNQKSSDPGRWLIVRSPGPVYYQAAEPGKAPNPDQPMIRTAAAVEVENRSNVPQPLWGQRLFAVASSADELRAATAVSDIVIGLRAPPPTATAIGLKMYFRQDTPPIKPGVKPPPPQTRLHKLHLGEAVQFNVWLDKAAGFPGTGTNAQPPPKPVTPVEPPMPFAALGGGVIGGKFVAERLKEAALLTIETRGSFRYDLETNVARFETAPTASPNQSNNVEVVRVAATGSRDTLICHVLEMGFELNETKPNLSSTTNSPPGLRSVLATGPFVRLDSESEQLIAQGTSLHYVTDRAAGKTALTFKGSPIDAVKDRHRLKTADGIPAELTFTSRPGKPGPKGQPANITNIVIRGPGGIAFYDPAAKENAVTATWASTFSQTRETIGERELDLLTFDGGRFSDVKAGFELNGETLKLWLDQGEGERTPGMARAVPHRLQAIKGVHLKSPELIVDETDALSVWFRQADPLAAAPKSSVPAMPGTATAPPVSPVATRQPPNAAKPPPNPLHLNARTIEAWVARMPQPAVPAPSDGGASAKYDLERAVCTDRVDARQAASDPKKNTRGIDIRAAKLTLEKQRVRELTGFSALLTALPGEYAELHHENTSLAGPTIALDQLANFVRVTGPGAMKMPAGSSLTGTATPNAKTAIVRTAGTVPPPEPNKQTDLHVEWTERMEFNGADGIASFIGKVQAKQEVIPILDNPEANPDPVWGKSWVLCHRLDVRFDRPVYFNQFNRKPADATGGPKIAQAICRPAPVDDAGATPRADGFVLFEDEQKRRDQSIVRRQRVRAASLDFRGAERGGTLLAGGPGEVRLLQWGGKDAGVPGRPAASAATPAGQELKLTVVKYQTRLRMEDRGNAYQEAAFEGDVTAIQTPTSEFERPLEIHTQLPERSTLLTCDDILTVSTYRPQGGKPEQKMDALGNANFRTDEYRGRAHRIAYDGRIMTLEGTANRLALIERSARSVGDGSGTPARRIEYDTIDGRIKIVEGAPGSLTPR